MKFSNTVKSALPVAILGFLALGLASTPAAAATASTTFNVNATVSATCTISPKSLEFGTYDGTQVQKTTTLSVTCTNTTGYNVGFNAGNNSTDVTTRKMASGSSLLSYSLFSDANYKTNWGNTVKTDTVSGTGDGSAHDLTVYGQIPAGQYVTPGSYTDTITATITY